MGLEDKKHDGSTDAGDRAGVRGPTDGDKLEADGLRGPDGHGDDATDSEKLRADGLPGEDVRRDDATD
ncbi:hypothetical protein ACX8Z9_01795 [Arthrobacter halodurans]|uniref:Uncharacterized protein n=1 Tax=Arthrobacter halodurans TaxID=516699 RepID=A0ABV4UL35_9MICC